MTNCFLRVAFAWLVSLAGGEQPHMHEARPIARSASRSPGELPTSIRVEPLHKERWKCRFQYACSEARSVSLVGTFNDWRAERHPMRNIGGKWTAEVALDEGVYEYKFLVDDSIWELDPLNTSRNPNGRGGHNSVFSLGWSVQLVSSTAVPGDGQVEVRGLRHLPDELKYCQRLDESNVLLRYQTLAHDLESVGVSFSGATLTPLSLIHEGPVFSIYEARVPMPSARTTETLSYRFHFRDGLASYYDPERYALPPTGEPVTVPEWAKGAVWYQIMLDRFRNGDGSNDPDHVVPWTSVYDEATPWEREGDRPGRYRHRRYYGGDLAGLREKLPYLKKLGVDAIYLNPVFEADSHHKYNTTTYLHVDDHFGVRGKNPSGEDLLDPRTWQWTPTDKLFLELLKEAHALGMKIVIDGVFNHVGTRFAAFEDVRRNGAASKYADWFDVRSWEPFRYRGWSGHSSLPVFRKNANGMASEEVKRHLFAVTRRWMDPDGDGDPCDGIDGWRLDVANEVPLGFWEEWRRHVKSINPDALIVGEIWGRAERYLDGRHFDAVMNYQFAEPVIEWIFNSRNRLSVSELDHRLADVRLAYPVVTNLVLQNLLGSHDTDRVASMAFNPDRHYDRFNRPGSDGAGYVYRDSKPDPKAYARARLAMLVQMTYVGAPMVYYGDEVGMWGADDPDCRKPMLWTDIGPYEDPDDRVMPDHFKYCSRAMSLRRHLPVLRNGSFRTILVDDQADIWAFRRSNGLDVAIVVINASGLDRRVVLPVGDGANSDSGITWRLIVGDGVRIQGAGKDGEVRAAHELVIEIPSLVGAVLSGTEPAGN